jgi:hypothetical protein
MIDDNSFKEILHAARIQLLNFYPQCFFAKLIGAVYTVGIYLKSTNFI